MEVQVLQMRVPPSLGAYSCAGGEGFGRQSPWMPSRRDSSLDLRGLERTKPNVKPAPSFSYDRSWVSVCIFKKKKKVLVSRSSQAGAGCFGFSQNSSSRMGLLPSTGRVRFISIFFLYLCVWLFIYQNNCSWFTVTEEGSVRRVGCVMYNVPRYLQVPTLFWFCTKILVRETWNLCVLSGKGMGTSLSSV